MEKPQFRGDILSSGTEHPYGLITGDVARVVKMEFPHVVKERGLDKAGFAVNNIIKVINTEENSNGVLTGSTPDVLMVLNNYFPTRDYGFTVATPQQMAWIYNTNPSFIQDKFWADIQLIRNPHADLSKKENRVPWMLDLNEQLCALKNRTDFLAVPYSAIIPTFIEFFSGYKLSGNAENLVKVIEWAREDAKHGNFNRLNEITGVPDLEKDGKRIFCGPPDKLFSRFCLYWGAALYAYYYGLADSDEDGRIVGWKT
jgi:hypothetical protein